MSRKLISHVRFGLLSGAIAVAALALTPVIDGALAPAHAQVTISAEFRTVLEPHGRFQRHSRWGEVWIPANRTRDWRPYTVGRWVYTEEWGWYWVEDQPEAAWGTVAFHYGRWVYDDELRWVWVAGDEWGPGWVQWRQGRGERRDYVGWAPMAPEGVAVEYVEKPEVWIFVRGRNFTAPRMAAVVVPQREMTVILRETVIVNRTVVVRDRFAVNPGIAPAIIAVAVGRPIRAYEVRPRVIAGTVDIPNAVVIRPDELRRNPRANVRIEVRETRTEIRASQQVADPQPLGANERGRLGDTPPRAAQTGSQTPAAGSGQQPGQPAAGSGQQQGQDAAKQQQGRDAAKQQPGQDAATPKQGQDAAKQQGQDAATQQQGQDTAKQKQGQDTAKQKQGQDTAKQKQGQDTAKQKQDAAKKQQDDARAAAKQKQDDARESAKQKSDAAKKKQDDARDATRQKQPSVGESKQKQEPKASEGKGREGNQGQQQQSTPAQPQPKQEGRGAGSEGQQKQVAPAQPPTTRTEGRSEGQGKGQGAPKAKQEQPKAKPDGDAQPPRVGAPPQ